MQDEQKRKMPKYSGVLQTVENDISSRKKLGRIFHWENSSANPRSPKFFGTIHTSYGRARVSLWEYFPRKKQEEQRIV